MAASFRRRDLTFSALGLLASLAASWPAEADVGARVLLQLWNPTTPDQQSVKIVTDDPHVVSEALASGWGRARGPICNELVAQMGKPRIVNGQTLREIDCRLGEVTLSIARLPTPNVVQATLLLKDAHIAATSTTPTALGSYADPRFSLDVSAQLDLTMVAQPSPTEPLRVTVAKFKLSGANIDSQNAPADVIKFFADTLSPFFGGPNYKHLAENAIDSIGQDLVGYFNAALAPVNAALAGPAGNMRIAIWGRPQRITIAFAPLLTPPSDGRVSGSISWDAAEYTPREGCASFVIAAAVQVGPAPMLDPDNYAATGPTPMRDVGEISMRREAPLTVCAYTLAKLPARWPTHLTPTLCNVGSGGGNAGLVNARFALRPNGWAGTVVPDATERNFAVAHDVMITDVPRPSIKLPDPADPAARLSAGPNETTKRLNDSAFHGGAPQPSASSTFSATRRQATPSALAPNAAPPSAFERQR